MRIVALLALTSVLSFGQDQSDPWPPSSLLEPSAIAAMLTAKGAATPVVFYVGFPNLYTGAHVRGATLQGPGSKPAGLESLRKAAAGLPQSQPVVIYCGCCPFDRCPNIRPAYRVLKEQGFNDIRVMKIPTNLHTDWVAKGYPTVRGASAQ